MHETNLVGVHEAGIAHHVATVGEIDSEHGAAAVGDGAGAVVVELFVVMGTDVAARENIFQVFGKSRVDGHKVLEHAMLGALFDHEDLAVALNDLRLDFADGLVQKDLVIDFAVYNLLTNLWDATGAKRIGFAGPAQWRLRLLVAFEQRLIRPLWSEGFVLLDLVDPVKDLPDGIGADGYDFFEVFYWFMHALQPYRLVRDPLP